MDKMDFYEMGVEAHKLDSLAVCVRDAIVGGDWETSAYIGGLDVLCDKTHELSKRVDALLNETEV